MLIQGKFEKNITGQIEIFPEYIQGLKDIEGFSHLILIYYFNKAKEEKLIGKPFLEDESHGIFAIRSPMRPNHIGFSIVKLKKIENKRFKIIPKSIFNSPEDIPKKYDVIIALSIFHHFIKEEKIFKKFIEFLKTLKGKELFFEPHNPDEPQMRGAYRNFDNDEFAEFIVENSAFTAFKKIGFSEHGRALYKIY